MAHKLTLTGVVLRVRKGTKGGEKMAIVQDSHSYLIFSMPDRGYVKGQTIAVEGRIVEVERGSGYIRVLQI